MLTCKKPYLLGVMPVRCYQCMACRIQTRKVWASRLFLEALEHEQNCFVTLTYDKNHLPEGGSLVPSHVRDWLKRVRSRSGSQTLRFFLAGEYGDQTWRPHYHVAMFGAEGCERGRTEHRFRRCCQRCDFFTETWGHGSVDVGELNQASASYVAGYVTKKMTEVNSWTEKKLKGRHPEFARMSLRPGLGYGAAARVAAAISGLSSVVDVPGALRVGGRSAPLGRYLRKQVLKRSSALDARAGIFKEAYFEKLRRVFEDAVDSSSKERKVLAEKLFEGDAQRVANLIGRVKIFNKGGSL